MSIGIDAIGMYVPRHYLDMETLAKARGADVDKFKIGIGQDKMAVISPSEDIVTMAAEAARTIARDNRDSIDAVFFATESAIDFSKSAGNHVHRLLGLRPGVRILEMKQACYAATGALHLAVDHVRANPGRKVLVIASDIAWYGFGSPGEVTQGAGAVAMLVTENPRLGIISNGVVMTEERPDFYRPSYHDVPVVDGKLSILCYNDILRAVAPERPFPYVCFHLPFSNMADKANRVIPYPVSDDALDISKKISRVVGNIYNGSLFLSLLSVLIHAPEDLSGKEIGMFSYGSGSIGEFFTLTLEKTYRDAFCGDDIIRMLESRIPLSIEEYEDHMMRHQSREHTLDTVIGTDVPEGRYFALEKIESGHRRYVTRPAGQENC
jgi:hydroxymethylglutaryl-CoA synthase